MESDYNRMKEMFFDKYPDFSDVIDELRNFEESLKIWFNVAYNGHYKP